MKKLLLAALAAGTLATGACSALDSESDLSDDYSAPAAAPVLESTVVAPAAPSTGVGSEQRTRSIYYSTLASEGIVIDDESAYIAGLATCEFIDDGGSMSDLMVGLALGEEDPLDLGISNDDLPFLMGAAIGAFCPENAGAIR